MAIPELPELAGVPLRDWLMADGPQEFHDSVTRWGRELPQGGHFMGTSLPVAAAVGSVWPWCSGYRDYVERQTAAGGVLAPIRDDVSPVTQLHDALVEVERARAAKKEPGGRAKLADALERVNTLQPAADEHYAQTRAQVGQKLAVVAAKAGPVGKHEPPTPVRVPVTIH